MNTGYTESQSHTEARAIRMMKRDAENLYFRTTTEAQADELHACVEMADTEDIIEECRRVTDWPGVGELHNTKDYVKVIANQFGSVRYPLVESNNLPDPLEEGCGNDSDLWDWSRGG